MNYWLAQLILAARKSDEENGWVQILVFVILSVFWALASIIKAKANKGAAGKEPTSGKPASKPPELTIDIQMLKRLFGLPEEPESSSQPSPEVSKPLVRAESAVARQAAKQQVRPTGRKVARPQPVVRKMPIETSKIAVMEAQVQPKLEKVPGLTGEAEGPTEIPQAKYLTDILSDYEDSEKLRRAILHYEILGKPVALREPEGR